MNDTVNVDTLVERLCTHITTDGLVVPSDEALATLDDLAARAREAEQRVRELEADPDRPTVVYAGDELEAAEDDRDRLARRVAELEAANRFLEDFIIEHGLHDEMVEAGKPDALAGDGGGA